jgi:hypothetical protein
MLASLLKRKDVIRMYAEQYKLRRSAFDCAWDVHSADPSAVIVFSCGTSTRQ